jgi:hemoglobin
MPMITIMPSGKTTEALEGTTLLAAILGPKLYSAEKGHPRLRQRHLGFRIGERERDAWLLCMSGALEETVANEQARHEIYATLAKLADWMRNQAGNPHDKDTSRL